MERKRAARDERRRHAGLRTNQFPTNAISFAVTAGNESFIWAGLGTYNGPVVSSYELTVSLP